MKAAIVNETLQDELKDQLKTTYDDLLQKATDARPKKTTAAYKSSQKEFKVRTELPFPPPLPCVACPLRTSFGALEGLRTMPD